MAPSVNWQHKLVLAAQQLSLPNVNHCRLAGFMQVTSALCCVLYVVDNVTVCCCSYHTIQGKALSAADLHDGMKLKTVSQHELTVKVDK
jgi:hypothetical protein